MHRVRRFPKEWTSSSKIANIQPRQSTLELSLSEPSSVEYTVKNSSKQTLALWWHPIAPGDKPVMVLESTDGKFEIDLRKTKSAFVTALSRLAKRPIVPESKEVFGSKTSFDSNVGKRLVALLRSPGQLPHMEKRIKRCEC